MKTYNYFGKEQKIYHEKLDNGLNIYVIPNKKKGNYYIELVTKYGSNIRKYKPLGSDNYLTIPDGVAHFLEHKIFDDEKEDPFKFYSKTGTYVNAGTNYFYTKYYLDGKEKLAKNLDYLLTMVYTPYFIPEKIESERDIIAQEIKMYDDEADWVLDYEVKRCLFENMFQDKIAGTCESIKKIDANILKSTYELFYQPSNMFLVASGNVKVEEIIATVKNNEAINKKKTNFPIIYQKPKETKNVLVEYKRLEANIVIPKVVYSYKFDLSDYPFDYYLTRLYLNLLFTHLFGDTSAFYDKVMDKGIVVDFYIDHITTDNIYVLNLGAESEYADLFKDEIDYTLQNIMINEDDFERIKKIWMSIVIRSLDNKEHLVYSVVDDIIKDDKIYDQYELIKKINYDDLLTIIKQIDLNNSSFVLMLPKEK